MESKIITISGTSGAGKTHLVGKIIERFPNITEIPGITTRPKREGEIDGQSSYFITLEKFKELENNEQLMLIKEFFDNKYAWLKSDLTEREDLRIMNISYKSIKELRTNKLNLFSIFIRPESEEKLKEKLKLRRMSTEQYEKRLKDYYESEKYLSESPEDFDLVITNRYDDESIEKALEYIANMFFVRNSNIDGTIKKLLKVDESIEHKLTFADEIIKECQSKKKENSKDGR